MEWREEGKRPTQGAVRGREIERKGKVTQAIIS